MLTSQPRLKKLVESFRDWGRDCWCEPGKDNTCGKRFDWQLGDLPHGYDHKYIYSHIGYNLKLTDMQAAVGVAQLGKLDGFVAARRANFARLPRGPGRPRGVPRPAGGDARLGAKLVRIPAGGPCRGSVRPSRAGRLPPDAEDRHPPDLRRQPAAAARLRRASSYRQVGDLANSDFVMNQALWVGVYPGLSPAMIDFMVEGFHAFCHEVARA